MTGPVDLAEARQRKMAGGLEAMPLDAYSATIDPLTLAIECAMATIERSVIGLTMHQRLDVERALQVLVADVRHMRADPW
jgi:hypothetical protein